MSERKCETCEFADWLAALQEDVIQEEYGYEPGEFTVYPDEWCADYEAGLTPLQAFKNALDAFAKQRADDDKRQAENWARIQAEDAKYCHGTGRAEAQPKETPDAC